MARIITRIRACHGCYYGCCYGNSMVVAMIVVMGLLWLLLWLVSWDCYDWYYGIAMVGVMGLL